MKSIALTFILQRNEMKWNKENLSIGLEWIAKKKNVQ